MITDFLIHHFSYTILYIWSVFEGEIGVTLAGVMSKNGSFDFLWVVLIASSGAFLGDVSLFLLGKYASNRVEMWLQHYKHHLEKIEHWFGKNAAWLILFERFIYGTHIPSLLFIGMSGYSFIKFLFFDIVGVTLWALTFTTLGYYFANNIVGIILVTQRHLSLFLLLLFLLFILYFQKKSYNKEEENNYKE